MNSEELKKRTRDLAHNCIKLAQTIKYDPVNQHLKLQLIRAATSMAANYQAACISQSPLSFIAKLSISIEEADKIKFWLIFMDEEKILKYENVLDVINEANAITNILCRSRLTARKNLKNNTNKSSD